MLEVERYYRILDVEPGASPEEIHQGYLDLTWVWHPDRFVGHPRLQQKAHHKLQQLNEAHERLRSLQSIQTRRLHAKSRAQASPSPSLHNQSPTTDLRRADVSTDWGKGEARTVQDYKRVSFKPRSVHDWLD